MAYRKPLPQKRSRSMFTATASRTHKRNTQTRPKRGGYRL